MEINKYMTINEASERFDVKVENLKAKLKPSRNEEQINKLIDMGYVKKFKKEDGARYEWIISTDAMEYLYNKKEEIKND